MYTSTRRSLLLGPVLALAARGAAAAGPAERLRGWYIEGSDGNGPFVRTTFGLTATFWVAHLLLVNTDALTAEVAQGDRADEPRLWKQVTVDATKGAPRRLFFDALLPRHNTGASRMVLVRRELECGQPTYYVEPVP